MSIFIVKTSWIKSRVQLRLLSSDLTSRVQILNEAVYISFSASESNVEKVWELQEWELLIMEFEVLSICFDEIKEASSDSVCGAFQLAKRRLISYHNCSLLCPLVTFDFNIYSVHFFKKDFYS